MEKETKTVPKKLGHLAAGLAKIIGEIDELKAKEHPKIMKEKEK